MHPNVIKLCGKGLICKLKISYKELQAKLKEDQHIYFRAK
jgi:hypothetical protein